MPIKRTGRKTPVSPAPLESEAASYTSTNGQQDITEHITRLQQRQQELVEETARELEAVRQKLAQNSAVEGPLQAEIANLRAALERSEEEKSYLAQEIGRLQSEYQGHYAQVQSALDSLRSSIGETPRISKPSKTPAPIPPPRVEAQTIVHDIQSIPARPPRAPRNWVPIRRIAIRAFALALLVVAGRAGWQTLAKHQAKGEVAGATTTTLSTDSTATENPADKYKESYAVVPFNQTEWETYTDNDLGFNVRYPKNTTNRVKPVGGSNVWFLRFDSFLMKVSIEETTDVLDDWWQKNKSFYSEDNNVEKGTFKGRQAWIITSKELTPSSGTTYITQSKTGIVSVWVKDEDAQSDDGKRITKMVDGFTFLADK